MHVLDDPVRDLDQQIKKLLKRTSGRNKVVLPALLNPEPLLDNDEPECYSFNSPEEAYLIVRDAVMLMDAIPRAKRYITKFVGDKTVYDAEFDPEMHGDKLWMVFLAETGQYYITRNLSFIYMLYKSIHFNL